jgi:hypothetical protein
MLYTIDSYLPQTTFLTDPDISDELTEQAGHFTCLPREGRGGFVVWRFPPAFHVSQSDGLEARLSNVT